MTTSKYNDVRLCPKQRHFDVTWVNKRLSVVFLFASLALVTVGCNSEDPEPKMPDTPLEIIDHEES